MKIKLIITFIITAIITSCGIFKQNTTKDTVFNKWKIVEIYDENVPSKLNGIDHYISLDNQNYSASTGCNTLNGSLTIKGGKINFQTGISTLMACKDMKLENNLKKLFSDASTYRIENNILQIINKNNKVIARLKLFQEKANDNTALLKGEWQVDYIAEAKSNINEMYTAKKPTIKFDVNENTFTGNGSCNKYSGTFETKINEIHFGAIASTKMSCPTLEGESHFFKMLNKVNSYSVNGNTLTLIMGDIAIIRLKKI